MRRGGRIPRSSVAPSAAAAAERAHPMESSVLHPRNLDHDFLRRDSDAASLSSMGTAAAPTPAPALFTDRASQAAALRVVNAFLAPAVALRGPLPAARDILAAFRLLLERAHYPLREKEAAFEDDLLFFIRLLGCPYKLTRSALKAPGTPHSWPPLLSVLHWLTLYVRASEDDAAATPPLSNDVFLYTTQAYAHFISGDDSAVEAIDNEYLAKARDHADAAIEGYRAREKEAAQLEELRNQLTSGPSLREALEAENETLTADVPKFEKLLQSWTGKISNKEQTLADAENELKRKLADAQRIAAENEELAKKVEAQAVNVRDADRMRREIQAVEHEIAQAEEGKAALEEKSWELDAALLKKFEELEALAEQCNQILKRLKPAIDFQFVLNAKGSPPAEILGLSYKTVLKPALKAHAEEIKRVSTSMLGELVDLRKELQINEKTLGEKTNNLSSLQARTDKILACVNVLDDEIANHDSRCTAEAKQMKDELEKKEQQTSDLEKESDNFLKDSDQRHQVVMRKAIEETQLCANEVLQLIDGVAEHLDFMDTLNSARRKELTETAEYIVSLQSKTSSSSQTSRN
ncbi:hypothetical protein ACP4OV_020684 [Aristida adscensionis]